MLVFYDLETGGLPLGSDILEIGAVAETGEEFATYVTPTKPINPESSAINGLTNQGEELFLHGKRVRTVPLRQALRDFFEFLEGLGAGNGCILVAHNGSNFDHRFLAAAVKQLKCEGTLQVRSYMCADTVPVFMKILKSDKVRLADLVKKLLGQTQSHGALSDARQLKQVAEHLGVTKGQPTGGGHQLLLTISAYCYYCFSSWFVG